MLPWAFGKISVINTSSINLSIHEFWWLVSLQSPLIVLCSKEGPQCKVLNHHCLLWSEKCIYCNVGSLSSSVWLVCHQTEVNFISKHIPAKLPAWRSTVSYFFLSFLLSSSLVLTFWCHFALQRAGWKLPVTSLTCSDLSNIAPLR